jgi:hypothetical protein
MGAWSHEPFGNDTAGDWAYGLEEATDTSLLEEAFDTVLASGDEYLESPEAEEAIAAAEVVAKMLGKGTQIDAYTEKIDEWVSQMATQPTIELRRKAAASLRRILAPNSELPELWAESDEAEEWTSSMQRLIGAVEA